MFFHFLKFELPSSRIRGFVSFDEWNQRYLTQGSVVTISYCHTPNEWKRKSKSCNLWLLDPIFLGQMVHLLRVPFLLQVDCCLSKIKETEVNCDFISNCLCSPMSFPCPVSKMLVSFLFLLEHDTFINTFSIKKRERGYMLFTFYLYMSKYIAL